jgi:hypothetical protein
MSIDRGPTRNRGVRRAVAAPPAAIAAAGARKSTTGRRCPHFVAHGNGPAIALVHRRGGAIAPRLFGTRVALGHWGELYTRLNRQRRAPNCRRSTSSATTLLSCKNGKTATAISSNSDVHSNPWTRTRGTKTIGFAVASAKCGSRARRETPAMARPAYTFEETATRIWFEGSWRWLSRFIPTVRRARSSRKIRCRRSANWASNST